MALLSDTEIRKRCTLPTYMPGGKPMVEPFSESVSGNGVISYGLDHAGYCCRLHRDLYIFHYSPYGYVDPKSSDARDLTLKRVDCQDGKVILPPHTYVLGRSAEYFRIPRNLKGRVVGKSTYARSGVLVNCTPLEPGWEGTITLEIGNITPCPAVLYFGEGIAQIEFELIHGDVERSYSEKGGVYNRQQDVTFAKVKN